VQVEATLYDRLVIDNTELYLPSNYLCKIEPGLPNYSLISILKISARLAPRHLSSARRSLNGQSSVMLPGDRRVAVGQEVKRQLV
jgi:hypothetical protein